MDSSGHNYIGSTRAGQESPEWPYVSYSWEALLRRVDSWLREVKRDADTPDLWAELRREREMLGGVPDKAVHNTSFTQEEHAKIAEQLREIKEYVKKTYSLSEAQWMLLEARLDYLQEAASRIGRLDWRNAFLGAILGLIFSMGLPPNAARDIVLMGLRALAYLFGHPMPELPNSSC
jgi:hypothetical protein